MVFACQREKRPERPDNLISKEKMADVLIDMFIVNSAKGVNKRVLERNGVNPETYILDKHGIDSLQFAQSNAYYAYDIEGYKKIMDDVAGKIERQKVKYDSINKVEEAERKRKNDSVKAATRAKYTKPKVKIDSAKAALEKTSN